MPSDVKKLPAQVGLPQEIENLPLELGLLLAIAALEDFLGVFFQTLMDMESGTSTLHLMPGEDDPPRDAVSLISIF